MLKFFVDHNVPLSVGEFLRRQGHSVRFVKDVDPEMTDIQVVKFAFKEKRIIVSNDKDFLGLSVKYSEVDMILFDYFSQKAEVRIKGLKYLLPEIKQGFGIIVLQ